MGTLSTRSAIISDREFRRMAGGSPVICRHRLTKSPAGNSARVSWSVAGWSVLGNADWSMRLNGADHDLGLSVCPGW